MFRTLKFWFSYECVIVDIYAFPGRITPVFEHKSSIVTLHCDIEKPTDPLIEVRVIWLFSDTILEPSEYVEIVKPVSLHYFHFTFPKDNAYCICKYYGKIALITFLKLTSFVF